jgi:hypothetical protein
MTMKSLGRIVFSALVAVSAVAPALALDYEAKPVMWVLQAPFRTMGAFEGAMVTGLVSGPIDGGFHGSIKGDNHWAGKFGDEKGWGQRAAAAPVFGTGGAVVGGSVAGFHGFSHGWKKGWEKPFSRWSYITMEEK